MTDQGAHQAVVTSALIVSGAYFYRKLTHTTGAIPQRSSSSSSSASALLGAGPQAPLGKWLVGFGAAYFGIAVIATISPELGAWLAILLAAGTLLTNGMALATDVNRRVA